MDCGSARFDVTPRGGGRWESERLDARGVPLRDLCTWCYACRRFASAAGARVSGVSSFVDTQNAGFRIMSTDVVQGVLAMPAEQQAVFWFDQLSSGRSDPFGSFRDPLSDGLLCSMFAWEPGRFEGARSAHAWDQGGAAREALPDLRVPALLDLRDDVIGEFMEAMPQMGCGYDEDDAQEFLCRNGAPVEVVHAMNARTHAGIAPPRGGEGCDGGVRGEEWGDGGNRGILGLGIGMCAGDGDDVCMGDDDYDAVAFEVWSDAKDW